MGDITRHTLIVEAIVYDQDFAAALAQWEPLRLQFVFYKVAHQADKTLAAVLKKHLSPQSQEQITAFLQHSCQLYPESFYMPTLLANQLIDADSQRQSLLQILLRLPLMLRNYWQCWITSRLMPSPQRKRMAGER